jgi:hypothetical protein
MVFAAGRCLKLHSRELSRIKIPPLPSVRESRIRDDHVHSKRESRIKDGPSHSTRASRIKDAPSHSKRESRVEKGSSHSKAASRNEHRHPGMKIKGNRHTSAPYFMKVKPETGGMGHFHMRMR